MKRKMEIQRAYFLETKLGEVLKKALPGAAILSNIKWRLNGDEYETDHLVLLDRTVVIAEAKSHHLTPEGLRGAPERVKRHIQELVLHPSIQSKRLEKLIVTAQDGDEMAGKTVRNIGIDPFRIDRIIRLSVSIDDLSHFGQKK